MCRANKSKASKKHRESISDCHEIVNDSKGINLGNTVC